jgi:3-oxoacyl-[acyl-carrier-protein] synthase II
MTALAVTGWSALCAAGIGTEAIGAVVAAADPPGPPGPVPVGELYGEPVPDPRAYVLADFNVRDRLGRKGTSLLDRWTAFSVVTSGLALEDGGVVLDDRTRDRIGLVLGTTAGSLRSTSDFSRDTMVQDKPYMVTPSLFPNTVMNCATGQSAIWHGLRGVNATVAGGPVAFLQALRYARTCLARGYVDTLLAGAMEEYSPHAAWTRHRAGSTGPQGEGGAVFVLERRDAARAGGRSVDAEILAVSTGFALPDGDPVPALADQVRRALIVAGVEPSAVVMAATDDPAGADGHPGPQAQAVTAAAPGATIRFVPVRRWFGDCQAASGALALAAVLALHRAGPELDGAVSVLTGRTADGGVGAAVVRGWCRGSRHHG